ncbi:MAG: hypothetical protein JKX98_02405, partial [Alcanivoracaceae bacterium]|nr:hypothetical protein [Alcanivoracaceae bacterium]
APSPLNPLSYTEKRNWIEKYFGINFVDRLILCMNKGLLKGEQLIDDYTEGRGQENFEGSLIQFGSKCFPDWKTINEFLHCEGSSPELTTEEQELLYLANQRLQESIEDTQNTRVHLSESLHNLSGNKKNRELGKMAESINELFGASALSLDFDDYSALCNEIVNSQQAIQKLKTFLNTQS